MLDSGFETAMAGNLEDDTAGFDSKGHASKSNAIRRILGLDGAGLLTTVQRTRTLSNLGSVFRAKPSSNLPGLGNWDNSCYQNSVLQGLASLESLPVFLNQATQSGPPQPTRSALKGIIEKLNDPENVGKTFWTPSELKSMSSWQQQDAQEYFSKISDELEKDTSKALERRSSRAGLEELSWTQQDTERGSSPLGDASPERNRAADSPRRSAVGQLPGELTSLIVRNPLEGLLAQRVGCQRCGFVEGLSLVPFNCLTVPLGMQWMYDVRTCLDDYTALEPINGVECAKCTMLHVRQELEQEVSSTEARTVNEGEDPFAPEASSDMQFSLQERLKLVNQALDDEDFSDQALNRCKILANNRVSTTKSRQAVIARAPKSLVIHVNRSNFDELTGVQSKNLANVRFPQRLDLAPWCLGHAPDSDEKADGVESWSVDPTKSMLSDNNFEDFGSGRIYDLRAVITHYGRHENGHYICYRKSPYSVTIDDKGVDECHETWWRLSDEDVTEVDEDIALAQGGVFMLFYEHSAPVRSFTQQQSISPKQQATAVGGNALEADDMDERPAGDDDPTSIVPHEELPAMCAESALPTPPQRPIIVEADEEPAQKSETLETLPIDDTVNVMSPPPLRQPPESLELPTIVAQDLPSTPLPSSTVSEPTSPKMEDLPADPTDTTRASTTPKENQPVSPASMRTAAPRAGRSSASRAGKAMGSVAGFVQAN